MMNPCSEIVLTKKEYVQPWVQIQLMQTFRLKQGLSLYSPEEVIQIESELTRQIDELSSQSDRAK